MNFCLILRAKGYSGGSTVALFQFIEKLGLVILIKGQHNSQPSLTHCRLQLSSILALAALEVKRSGNTLEEAHAFLPVVLYCSPPPLPLLSLSLSSFCLAAGRGVLEPIRRQ
jgi:hypothetical protein